MLFSWLSTCVTYGDSTQLAVGLRALRQSDCGSRANKLRVEKHDYTYKRTAST
jgi:hypothetical protein